MKDAISIKGLNHTFGTTAVLRDIDLTVRPGSIYGFLGRNGAGKSTCIRILAGLLERKAGDVRVLGEDPAKWSRAALERFGYVDEASYLPGSIRLEALIQWTRVLYSRWDDDLIRRLIARFRLDPRKRIQTMSLGQQRQVGFLLAIAPRPELLILDEPAANLDTVARRVFLDEIASLAREEGATVFFSTHVLSDVERVADQVGILHHGRLLVNEAMDDLKDSVRQVRFYWDKSEPPPVSSPGAFRTQRRDTESLLTMRLDDESQAESLAERAGCRWEARRINLEDLFIDLTEGETL